MPTKEWTDKPTGNELENGMCRLEPELEAAIFKNTEGLYEGDGIQSIPRLYTEIELQAAIAAAIVSAGIAAGNKIVEIALAENPNASPLKLQILRVKMERAVKASNPADAMKGGE